jgi:hypothetical protein
MRGSTSSCLSAWLVWADCADRTEGTRWPGAPGPGKAPSGRMTGAREGITDLVTSEEETLARVDGTLFDGLAVTSDGRLAFYPRAGPPSADLVMMEGG